MPVPAAPPRRRLHLRLSRSWLGDAGLVAVVVGVGFALFQPEWFANQNGLDPFFYTGLSLNLSDAVAYGADAHYFLSRWTIYVPELIGAQLLGPSAGFVAVRLVLLVLAGFGLALLRPAASRRLDLVPVAVVALFSPLLARAVFVDYSDAVVVPSGLVMVALAGKGRVGLRTSVTIGILAACAVVANASALSMVAITVAGYLARSLARPLRLGAQVPVIAGAALIVVGSGAVVFRWRYGIDDLYGPTIDFVRDNAGYRDVLRSPHLDWVRYQLWIYLPPVVLLAAAGLRAARVIRLDRGDLVVLGVCAAQYAFQVAYQFLFDGLTLEVGYYFSYMVPAYTAALAVVLYALLQRCSALATSVATAAVVVVLGAWRYLPALHLVSWQAFAGLLLAAAVLGMALARRLPVLLPVGLATVALAAQLASPWREPVRPGELRVQHEYHTLYQDRGERTGVAHHRAVAGFVRRMHTLDLDVRTGAGWIISGGLGPQMAAAYSVQVGDPSRWLNPPMGPPERQPLSLRPYAVQRRAELGLTHVVVVCSPEELPIILARLAELGMPLDPPVLDYVDPQAAPSTQVYVAPVRVAAEPATDRAPERSTTR